ncbi:AbrB/MazE/SpoVT family DNA-binding domain-containing protein [Desulfitobacterium sp.]|uniref:AbrB/MazE/SpoVT family DNA-binding domain-containing protein n=1 Tax=Desulfitobacterium sp. TaxID=49981 RepID=UPI002C8FF25A|nr:AbrB/MazE/SpoVT family DNA-binding domain-containing protein [Desulfitobacterium sp.]HVJ50300.1 AbrB/MazE/SpoVT family DNA-binding domain-containing protein [Desulfitobacterium sp.]
MQAVPPKKSYGLIRLGKRSVLTLGADLTRDLRLTDGDLLELCVQDGKIILEPKKVIPADQEWFWSEEWQAGEREAQAEIDAGQVKHFGSVEEFLKDLRSDDEDR